jgi:hypothetical protein
VASAGEALRRAEAARAVRAARRASPGEAQTRAEVRALERALAEAGPDVRLAAADGGRTMEISFRVLAELIDPARRLRTPDPVERYAASIATIQRTPGNARFDGSAVQKRMVFRAALESLRAGLPRPVGGKALKR